MNSAFLVIGLVGGGAILKRECDASGFIHPEFDDCEETVGLVI
jgi:hypothetical protein